MAQLLNLLDDNVVTANSRALFIRSSGSASTAPGSYFEFADVSNAKAYNLGGGFTITTNQRVTCNFDGQVNINGVLQGTSVTTQQASLWKNGVYQTTMGRNTGTTINLTLSCAVNVVNGDYLEIRNDGSGSVAIDANGFVAFERVAEFSAGAPVGFGLGTSTKAGLNRGRKVYTTTATTGGANDLFLTAAYGGPITSVTSAWFIPWEDVNGDWLLEFSYNIVVPNVTNGDFLVNGITSQNTGNQAVTVVNVSTGTWSRGYVDPNANTFDILTGSAGTEYTVSGVIRLASKPLWAD